MSFDAEKSTTSSRDQLHVARPIAKSSTRLLLAAQQSFAIITLILASLALDRSLVSFTSYGEEYVLLLSSAFAVLCTMTLQSMPTLGKSVNLTIQAFCVVILTVAFLYGAVVSGQGDGSCDGPAKIGIFDNHRACTRVKAATAFAAVDALVFGVAAAIEWRA